MDSFFSCLAVFTMSAVTHVEKKNPTLIYYKIVGGE